MLNPHQFNRAERNQRLSDVLYGQILQQIIAGAYRQGDKLPSENDICRAFDVSRPVVRQALQRLRADGIVVSRKGSGSYVTTKPPEKLTHVIPSSALSGLLRTLEVRLVLEPECARLAASRRTSQDLAAIEQALDRQHKALEQGEDGRAEDIDFHMAIANAAHNSSFRLAIDAISGEIGEFMRTTLSLTRAGSGRRRRQVLEEHGQILQAIDTFQPDSAALFMRYHLMQARLRLTDARLDHDDGGASSGPATGTD